MDVARCGVSTLPAAAVAVAPGLAVTSSPASYLARLSSSERTWSGLGFGLELGLGWG